MFAQCAHCGVYNNDTDKVCSQCGNMMPREAKERTALPPPSPKHPHKVHPHIATRYLWAPIFGAITGLLIGLRIAIFMPAGGKPNALLSARVFYCIVSTMFGILAGSILWIMNLDYFNNKHTQLHPNRTWRVIPAILLVLIPFVGLLASLWAKRGNRLPSKAKNSADVTLMISAIVAFVVILVVAIVSNIPPKQPLAG